VRGGGRGRSARGAPAVSTETAARRRRLRRRFALRLAPAMIGANTAGAVVVYVYLVFLSPSRADGGDPTGTLVNTIVFLGYSGLATLLGIVGSVVVLRDVARWLSLSAPASPGQRRRAVRTPVRLVRVYATLWAVAVVVFAALNLNDSFGDALTIGATIALGGMTTSALSYLLAERLVRPVVVEAMAGAPEPPPVVLPVRRRVLLAWALGTAVPVAGIFLGVLDLDGGGRLDRGALLFLSGVALGVGALAMRATARSLSDPVESVTRVLQEVAAGRFDVQVPVYDGSEIGQLQSGVNRMVEGLRERERLRDLFGRQVGEDVARSALERGVALGGERCDTAVLFVDVIGSTALAEQQPAEVVVQRLNAFFGTVVDVVTAHHGWVNKFAGDGALCVFGAPVQRPDAAACALAAARALGQRLQSLPLEAAIGVASGPVVAGHVGAESRFEYTVIGDPANAAARLCELAKSVPGRVLADAASTSAGEGEASHWVRDGEVLLRGRSVETCLVRPR
jgi:adenylate cyclase